MIKNTLFNVAGIFNSNNPLVIAKAVNEGLSDIWIVTPVKFEKNVNVNVNVFITELKNLLKLNYQNVLF